MREAYEPIQIGPVVLRQYLTQAKEEGCRLVQAHACSTPEGYLLVYSVAKEYEIYHYEMHISVETVVESVSDIFPSAQLYEQEMNELFGVKISNQTDDPSVKLYHLPKTAPMK